MDLLKIIEVQRQDRQAWHKINCLPSATRGYAPGGVDGLAYSMPSTSGYTAPVQSRASSPQQVETGTLAPVEAVLPPAPPEEHLQAEDAIPEDDVPEVPVRPIG